MTGTASAKDKDETLILKSRGKNKGVMAMAGAAMAATDPADPAPLPCGRLCTWVPYMLMGVHE